MAQIKKLFTKEQSAKIVDAIKRAEENTSGEIRVHIESSFKGDILDRAAYIFEKLKMHQTELRNGVLIYLAVRNKQFAILGDAGINQKVPEGFWDEVRSAIQEEFQKGNLAEGLVSGIDLAGEKLKEHFPWQSDDINELKDEISYGS